MTISQATTDALLSQGDASAQAGQTDGAGVASGQSPESAPASSADSHARDLHRILGLSLPVTVTLAERNMAIEMILATRVGTIIEFNVPFDAELTLCVANQRIGQGHAVKIGENFGLRITRIDSVQDRIEALGAGLSSA
ncbi:MAG: FliM/FliN family flagellar motor switch protein [Planctomycetota bacterium]|jgi:flagellar motor switch protein FliN/FliY